VTTAADDPTGARSLSDLAERARWIGRDPDAVEEVIPRYPDDRPGITLDLAPPDLLRTELRIRSGVRDAELLLTARGIARCWLDGRRVGDDELAPGWTDHRVRYPVRRHDVTALVPRSGGTVCWAAEVADGWYCGYVGMDRRRQARWYGTTPALRAALRIRYDDGAESVFATDAGWRRSTGADRYADLLMGQMIDLDLDPAGWRQPGFDDAAWPQVAVVADDGAELTESIDPPVRVIDVVAPIAAWSTPSGRLVADFGVNLVGRLRVDVSGLPAGTRLHLRHGETVLGRDDGELALGRELYVDNLRTARAHDLVVVGRRPVGEPVEPWATFHGFRYAEVSGFPGPVERLLKVLRAAVIASDVPAVGGFDCDDELVGRLHDNVVRTIRGNTVGLPTDCPQRDERLGWMADTQVIAPATAHLFDVGTFYEQWLVAVRDGQSATGGYPDVAPKLVVEVDGAPGWADAGVLVPWAQYRHDGDVDRLGHHYPSMVRFLDGIEHANADLVRRRGRQHDYGDWLCLGPTCDKALLATAYWALDARVMAAMAAALGLADDEARWRRLGGDVRDAFVAEFVGDAGRIGLAGQTALALALAFDLVPAGLRAECGDRLVAAIADAGGSLTTGIHGTRALLPALCDTGHVDVAYALLLRREYPSWGFSIDQGATTMWERWDAVTTSAAGERQLQTPALNSMNHPALGSVAEWLHAYVAGVRPGPRRCEVRPFPGGGLGRAGTRTVVAAGAVAASWALGDGEIVVEGTVPDGATAAVFVPSVGPAAIGGWEAHEVGAGSWSFRAAWSPSWRPGDSGAGLLYGTALP